MLTGKLVRVRLARNRVVPLYLDSSDPAWLETAERLLDVFRASDKRTRGEIEADLEELFGNDPQRLVYRGLAKLLEDRSEFATLSGVSPEQLRERVFQTAADRRRALTGEEIRRPFDRQQVIGEVAQNLGLTNEQVEESLFADLKSEQRLIRFKDTTAQRLLERYNVGLAQAVLLRSTRVRAAIRSESSQRYRQLLRIAKFHRLICEITRADADTYRLLLDGPLSLFTATQKYGVQLAMFLPAILLCRDFQLEADLLWGAAKKPKKFVLTAGDGLVSHRPDTGTYIPPELAMFVDLFRKTIADWEIDEIPDIIMLDDGLWVPDFRLRHRTSGRSVLLEVLGFWRRASAERHLERLRRHVPQPFLLAVSDKLCIDDSNLESLPAAVHRFRQMPLPEEIARLAEALVAGAAL